MYAIQLTAHGLDGLQRIELPDPTPGPHQILIKLRAASVNFRDTGVVLGRHRAKLPVIPLSDGVGTIVAVGEGVTRFTPGQRVSPVFAPGWATGSPTETSMGRSLGGDTDGVLREYMIVGDDDAVLVPEHLTDEEAACLPCAGVTAWSAVVDFGKVKPGDTVLVEGTGGVALFAISFAKAAGARVAVISSSDEKLERVRTLGAEILVNYKTQPEWGKAVRKATGGRGIDLAIGLAGASAVPEALAALSFGGRIAQIGLVSGLDAHLPLQHFIPKVVTMQGILVGPRTAFEAMNRAVAHHGIRPVIDRVFAFDESRKAIESLMTGSHFGKIAVTFG